MNPQGLQQLECLEALAPSECMLPSDWMWGAGVTAGLALDTCLPGPAAGSPEFPRNNTIWHKISAASEFPTYFILQCILVTSMSPPLFLLTQISWDVPAFSTGGTTPLLPHAHKFSSTGTDQAQIQEWPKWYKQYHYKPSDVTVSMVTQEVREAEL